MKPLDSWRPEPGPSARESTSLIIALAVAAIGCALGLNGFHKAGAIGDELYIVALFFVIAVPLGAIFAVVQERRAYRRARNCIGRMPRLYRVHTDWPPAEGLHKGGDRVSRTLGRRRRMRK